MNLYGYVRRPDGDFEKRLEFVQQRSRGRTPTRYAETLIRNADGKLLRVERTSRALKVAAAKRKKGA